MKTLFLGIIMGVIISWIFRPYSVAVRSDCFDEQDTMGITLCLEDRHGYWKTELQYYLKQADDRQWEAQKFWEIYKQEQIKLINSYYEGPGTATIYERLIPIINLYMARVYDIKAI